MMDLSTFAAAATARVFDAMVFALPASRTTPDGTVVDDAAPDAGGETTGGGVEMASRFMFDMPGEVKTGIMLVLAVAIGVYLYLNWMRDQP